MVGREGKIRRDLSKLELSLLNGEGCQVWGALRMPMAKHVYISTAVTCQAP